MFMNRKTKGYGWYSKVTNKDNPEIKAYIDFSFQRGTEPLNLNNNGSYQFDMYIVDKDGIQRKIFPIVEEYQGRTYLSYKIMANEVERSGYEERQTNRNVQLEEDDLPFM